MKKRRLVYSLALLLFSAGFVGAQQTPAPSATPPTGFVHTPAGAPIPGATVRLVNPATGQSWVSWTDETGKFDFPGLPGGHYRIEVEQLGFVSA
ncbi:MAG: carboxypeptidase regulatory-like domain-containing protein, partial [Candidatus Acidiferrales bacterium]